MNSSDPNPTVPEPHTASFAGAGAGVREFAHPTADAPQEAAKATFVGPQADVWALGVILYECASGNRPFTGDRGDALLIEIAFGELTAAPAVPRPVVPAPQAVSR